MHFLNTPFDKKEARLAFRKKLEDKINEYRNNGTALLRKDFSDEKIKSEGIQIKLNKEFINNCNEKLLMNIFKMNKKVKLCYDVKYKIIYSVLLRRCKSSIISNMKEDDVLPKNVYKIKKKNTSYFMNQYLIIKRIHSGKYGNIYYCKDVKENKKYCLKIFYLELCLKENCPYYVKNQVFLTNYFCKILNEIFFLNYLEDKNIIQIEKVFFDEKKKIFFAIFPYIKYQSMYYKKRYSIYSTFNKVVKLNKKKIEIYLYSENFLRHLFLIIYNTLSYLLQKSVAYLDLKPDNILFTNRNIQEIAPYVVRIKKKKKDAPCASKKCAEISGIEIRIESKLNKAFKEGNRGAPGKNAHMREKSSGETHASEDYVRNVYNNKIFANKKRGKTQNRTNRWCHSYCCYTDLSTKKLKKKKIKYIYNIHLSKCFEYDKNVKEIFFKEHKLDDIFYSTDDATLFIQTFIQKRKVKSKSKFSHPRQMHLPKRCINTRTNVNEFHSKKCQINKIRNLSIFKYKEKNSIDFLKFYWLYFNQECTENWNKEFLIYLDIYFVKRYLHKSVKTCNNDDSIDSLSFREKRALKRYKDEIGDGEKYKKHLKNEHNDVENVAFTQNSKKMEMQKLDKQKPFQSQEEININFMKLIDFDTCSFILKSCIVYSQSTDIFNSFECLFNVTNKDVKLSKKLAYNFGSVLYTFLFGKTPYHGDDIFEIYENMKNNRLVFPKYRKINKHLKNLLRKLLNNSPDKRMQFKKIKRHKWFSKFE
ncbi:hypothetical protein POVCU2_0039830 [Plasmodium ovale curtisi]|uniref:Protein kinase domain-containing protein n=1 Tax=Plasmodium ovale curtisi TaxID=864141 RepID=A0A1A8W5E4_PLAOA|nr:hypothetical protein POVCU2_0039830 [Plasmodium ovale curtisi]